MAIFFQSGVSFQYPDSWRLEAEEYHAGWAVSVHSPMTAFLSLTLDFECDSVALLTEGALEALRSEYKNIDVQEVNETLAGRPSIGFDVQFFAMDLTNSAWIRAAETAEGSLLLIWEANDFETTNIETLKAMCASLTIVDE